LELYFDDPSAVRASHLRVGREPAYRLAGQLPALRIGEV
jgi:hypothetical protein